MSHTPCCAVYHGPEDLRAEEASAARHRAGRGAAPRDGAQHLRHRPAHPPRRPPQVPGRHGAASPATRWSARSPGSGGKVGGLTVGHRVFVAPNMGCGHCRQCVSGNNNLCADYQAVGITLDGGFAEYMRIPARPLPRATSCRSLTGLIRQSPR